MGSIEEDKDERDEVMKKAAELGLVVVNGDDQDELLMLDLDSEDAYCEANRRVHELFKDHVFQTFTTRSKNNNYHLYVKLKFNDSGYSLEARIGLQAALGSDSLRELFTLMRTLNRVKPANVLFETPLEAYNVQRWLEV